MKWHLYKKDDPNTWPKIDCTMLVYFANEGNLSLACYWDNEGNYWADDYGYIDVDECYYAYITHAPNGYKTHKVLKCADDSNCEIGNDDDGYCMYGEHKCRQQVEVNEYSIEMKAMWKEFD